MASKRGLFIDFEGIDGSGKSTQIGLLADEIRKLNKYQSILLTREPTAHSSELKRKLEEEGDAFSNGRDMARLFVEDRKKHGNELLNPVLDYGTLVITDRYSFSTCAYQSAQGVDLEYLFNLHEEAKTLTPDITLFFNVSRAIAESRRNNRSVNQEKFEKDAKFNDILMNQYNALINESKSNERIRKIIGSVYVIDAEKSIGEISQKINEIIMPLYKNH